MTPSLKFAVALTAMLAAGSAQAALIVDTGASPFVGLPDPGISVFNDGAVFGYQSVAGLFETTQAYEITSLSAFVRNYACCSEQNMQLHLGIASGPADPSHASFTNFAPAELASIVLASGASGWASTDPFSLLLPAGTWWLVVSQSETDLGVGLGLPGGVPQPLSAYAADTSDSFGFPGSNGWNLLGPSLGGTSVPATFGFRIEGSPTSVAAPSASFLVLSGMAWLAFARRRRYAPSLAT